METVRKQILLVEDDDRMRDELKRWLAERNQHCVEVAHSTEARQRLAELDFALLVCDASMLEKLPLAKGTAVILTSAADHPAITRCDLGLGCYGFLVAPFSADELAANVSDASQRRASELEYRNRTQELQDVRGILRNVQEVVYRVDSTSCEFTYISPAFERMFGYSIDEIRSMGGRRAFLAAVIQEHQFDQQEKVLGDIRSTHSVLTGSAVAAWRCKNGSLKWIEDHWYPIYKDDELISTDGILYDITERKAAQEALVLLNNQLKARTAQLEESKQALETEVAARKQMELEIEKTHKKLLFASRQAGMAEVASGVLHNVGNVLNSVNVSASIIADQVRHTKAASVAKLAALFDQHKSDLVGFLTKEPRGQQIPLYLSTLAEALATEQLKQLAELENLLKNIEHIKSIVAMQQSYAQTLGVIEKMPVTDIIDDALRINAGSLARHDVETLRDYQAHPIISTDKHKVMQILINLVRNAKYACDESGRGDKRIIVRTTGDDHTVRIAIIDNGVGIPRENLTRIFNHGFTTRKEGHGFGLHGSALAARELGGTLIGQSDGFGLGATFILEIPLQLAAPAHDGAIG